MSDLESEPENVAANGSKHETSCPEMGSSEDETTNQLEKLNQALKNLNKSNKNLSKHKEESVKSAEQEFQKLLGALDVVKKRILENISAAYKEVEEKLDSEKKKIYSELSSIAPGSSKNGKTAERFLHKEEQSLPDIKVDWPKFNETLDSLLIINEKPVDLTKDKKPEKQSSKSQPIERPGSNFRNFRENFSRGHDSSTLRSSTPVKQMFSSGLSGKLAEKFTSQVENGSVRRIKYRRKQWDQTKADFASISDSQIAVADNTEGVIKVLSRKTGREEFKFEVSSLEDGEMAYISGIGFTTSGEVIATDRANNCVKLFNQSDSSKGELVGRAGKLGRLSGEFISPEGLCVLGEVCYVCDFGNNRVVKLNVRDVRKQDGFFRHSKVPGFVFGPSDITVDLHQRLLISEWGKARLVFKSSSGELYHKIGGGAGGGTQDDDSNLSGPSGVQVSADGKYYVADALEHKIKIYEKSGSFLGAFSPWHHGAEVHCIRVTGNELSVVDYANGEILVFDL